MRSLAVLACVAACALESPTSDDDRDDHRHGLDRGGLAPGELDPGPTPKELLARVSGCADRIGGPYAPGSGQPATIWVCGFPGAVVWTADLDIDCDGKRTDKCNPMTDPWFMEQTAATDSAGDPLDAAALPFVVVPGRSSRFDYRMAGLAMGSVAAVIHAGRVEYGPVGDVGPSAYIGEASYRMAELLGIDPDPHVGGTEDPVTYILFTGAQARLSIIEDHDEAVAVGIEHARGLLASD